MTTQLRITRDLNKHEHYRQGGGTLAAGTVVYAFNGCTYGCISPDGIAVSDVPNEGPFYEVPENAVETA